MSIVGIDGETFVGIDMESTLPPITITNKISQHASTSSSDDSLNHICRYTDDNDLGDYITDDDKISMCSEGKIIDSYLEDFLQREDELRKLMNLNNFNRILENEIKFEDQPEEPSNNNFKITNEDSAILTDLENKLADIQHRYNEILNIHGESDDEGKIGDDPLEFEEAKCKLEEIDKCLEDINVEKSGEADVEQTNGGEVEFIQKEYVNSLNEMTKKLDSLLGDGNCEEEY